jgi:site-specific DNA-methyltransferase (adenine-specific)
MTADAVIAGAKTWTVQQGDCLSLMQALPDACIDAIVADPPAGISFMGKRWDHDRGGRDQWIAWLSERMREGLRLLKPGGYAFVWALPRTSHWTGMALEEAGFEVRDRVAVLFGSGFPKSLNVSKAIEATVLTGGSAPKNLADAVDATGQGVAAAAGALGLKWDRDDGTKQGVSRHASGSWTATTEEAKRWEGWGTALKPAVEDWWLVRKPIRGSVAKNVLQYGTGALNIDACRVPHANAADLAQHAAGVEAIKARGGVMDNSWKNSSDLSGASDVSAAGRWPAHLLLSHAEGCVRAGTKRVKANPLWNDNRGPSLFTGAATLPINRADGDGCETVDAWTCVDGCAVKALDEQSGASSSNETVSTGDWRPGFQTTAYGDDGGASRYFTTFPPFVYLPKCDRADRENGCEHLPVRTGGELTGRNDGSDGLKSPRAGAGRGGGRRNHHPTVKSTDLMRWLVRLICPPGGVVLDPFCGSGSTGVACSAERLRFIGFELEPDYAAIARARIVGDAPLLNIGGI